MKYGFYNKEEFCSTKSIPDFIILGHDCRLLRSEYEMSRESHEMSMTVTMYITLVKEGLYVIYSIEAAKNIKNELLNSFSPTQRTTIGIKVTESKQSFIQKNKVIFIKEQHWRKNGRMISEQEKTIGDELVNKLNELF